MARPTKFGIFRKKVMNLDAAGYSEGEIAIALDVTEAAVIAAMAAVDDLPMPRRERYSWLRKADVMVDVLWSMELNSEQIGRALGISEPKVCQLLNLNRNRRHAQRATAPDSPSHDVLGLERRSRRGRQQGGGVGESSVAAL